MSMASYKQNVRRGVTGRMLPTCLPAALEKISSKHRLPPNIYSQYQEFVAWYETLDDLGHLKATTEHETVINDIVKNLGGLSCERLVFRNITRRYRLREYLGRMVSSSYRVVLDLELPGGNHAVGILPTDESHLYQLTSNWVPSRLHGKVSADDLFPLLAHHPEVEIPSNLTVPYHPLNSANLTALPPS